MRFVIIAEDFVVVIKAKTHLEALKKFDEEWHTLSDEEKVQIYPIDGEG